MLLSLLPAVFLSATSCLDDGDEPKDTVKEIMMSVSGETDVMYDLFDSEAKYPIECMLVMPEDNSGVWEKLSFGAIEGFTYERGHEYSLRVRRTILANPPADGSDRTYSLVRIVDDRVIPGAGDSAEKEIKTEADIEYEAACPVEKYAMEREFVVDGEGNVSPGGSYPSPYDSALIRLENVIGRDDPRFVEFGGVRYLAAYSYVISPLTEEIRLVGNASNHPLLLFREVVPQDEFGHVRDVAKPGEELRYSLVLANTHKKGIQKLQFTVRKQ